MRNYQFVSADGHLEVSPDRWRAHVPREFHAWCPTVVKLDGGGDAWKLPGANPMVPLGLNYSAGIGWKNLKTSGVSYADNPAGSGDGAQRLRELDQDGLDAEVLFPAIWLQRCLDLREMPREACVAIARGYNDWLSREFTAADPARLLGVGILPSTCADDAAAELRRLAAMPGIRTVVLHTWPNGGPAPDLERDEAFWRAAAETGFPLSVHTQLGGGRAADMPAHGVMRSPQIRHLLTHGTGVGPETGYCVVQLIASGVFDRFPSLRVAVAESGAGWIPYFAERADAQYKRHRYWSRLELAHEPSHYLRRHFAWGIQDDTVAVRLRDAIGTKNLMWGSDFPHVATDWPESRTLLDRLLGDVPVGDRAAIQCDNAVEFYHLAR